MTRTSTCPLADSSVNPRPSRTCGLVFNGAGGRSANQKSRHENYSANDEVRSSDTHNVVERHHCDDLVPGTLFFLLAHELGNGIDARPTADSPAHEDARFVCGKGC